MECCFSNFFGLSPLFGMKIIRWNLDPPRSTFALSVCFVFHDFFFLSIRFDSTRKGTEPELWGKQKVATRFVCSGFGLVRLIQSARRRSKSVPSRASEEQVTRHHGHGAVHITPQFWPNGRSPQRKRTINLFFCDHKADNNNNKTKGSSSRLDHSFENSNHSSIQQ